MTVRATSLFRHSPWDGLLVALSLVHGVWLLTAPSLLLVALGMWWSANTVAHNFVHLPFFRSARLNGAYATYLSLLQGFPQHLWKARHLAHHGGHDERRVRWTRPIVTEAVLIAVMWALIIWVSPTLFFFTYLPGFILGLGLCALQGHFEHVYGTTSHYGRAYNTMFFNDGYHVEHHVRPSEHWTRLRRRAASQAHGSQWPPVLRWLDNWPSSALDALERVVLRSPRLQSWVLARHQASLAACLAALPPIRRVTIVGGGLFPRTALALRQLIPDARLTILDSNAEHLVVARTFVGAGVVTVTARFTPAHAVGADLVVIPLAFVGDRHAIYDDPPAPFVFVHDWMWHRAGDGALVSIALLKRINVVRGRVADARQSA